MPENNMLAGCDLSHLKDTEIQRIYEHRRTQIVADELKTYADALLASDLPMRAVLTETDFAEMAVEFDIALADINASHETLNQIRERIVWNRVNSKFTKPKRKRVCIQRCGYAEIAGDTDEEIFRKAAELTEDQFDWERVNKDLIDATIEIVENVED